MLLLKILIVKLRVSVDQGSSPASETHLAAVDGLPAGPVAPLKVSSLDHEPRDDAMEVRSLVSKVLGQLLPVDFSAAAQRAEIGRRLRHDVVKELELDPADFLLCKNQPRGTNTISGSLTANSNLHPDVAVVS
jgi:hypothetical protein